MKSDLIITRFKTEPIIGTKETYDVRTFFGSKMVDIEDTVYVDNSKIQYSEMYQTGNTENNGYQFYTDIDLLESIYLIELSDIKYGYHTINLVPQSTIDLKNNTQWRLDISWKSILSDYIFYMLKNRRTFKCIKYTDVLSENINLYIRDYIKNNLVNRYEFTRIDLYVEYLKLEEGEKEVEPHLIFDPIYSVDVRNDTNLLRNANSTLTDDMLYVNYKQTQSSEKMKFNYYFDLIFTKV